MTTRVVITSDKAPLKNTNKEREWKRKLQIAIGTMMNDAVIEVEFQRKGK